MDKRVQVDGVKDLVSAEKDITRAINALNETVGSVFPQTIGTAASAVAGSATLPANPVGFLSVVNPTSGDTVLIPYYDPA